MATAKERKKGKEKDLFHYLKIVIVILSAAAFIVISILAFQFGRDIFSNEGRTGAEGAVTYTLTVTQGESVFRIGKDLEDHGIIRSGLVFWVQSKLYRCKIAPGEFTLSSDMSSKAILKYLHSEYLKTKDNAN